MMKILFDGLTNCTRSPICAHDGFEGEFIDFALGWMDAELSASDCSGKILSYHEAPEIYLKTRKVFAVKTTA